MEIPVCNGTYTNKCNGHCFDFFKDYNAALVHYIRNEHRPFFVSLCFYCRSPGQGTGTLYRCGGCQLVSYCSRYCQKNDRSSHKYMCKEFPVVNGKNALFTTGSWKNHIASLRKRADQLPQAEIDVKPIFRNPRVCRICHESRPDLLIDCPSCGCISYCSKRCKLADKQHMEECHQLYITKTTYTLDKIQYLLPSVAENTLCEKYELVTDLGDIFSCSYRHMAEELVYKENNVSVGVDVSWTQERLSYPLSLLYALQSLPAECYLGEIQNPLEDLTSLTIHVIISNPHLDSVPWEVFMHRLPELQNLNIVFIIQGVGEKQSYGLNTSVRIKRCTDCTIRQRVITYSIHHMMYHMYFSSPEYTDPDVVVIFGNTNEMSSSGDGDIHSKISYRNMTYNTGTVLVIMDTSMKMVIQGVENVNNARPVEELVSPRSNPLKGFSSNRAKIESDSLIINERSNFACLRRR